MQAVVAHELVEYSSPGRHYSWRHAHALIGSFRNPRLSHGARAIIADQVLDALVGRDAQIVPNLVPRIQWLLRQFTERAGLTR